VTQVLERTICATVTKDDKHVRTLMEISDMRQFSMQELLLLAELAGLEVSGPEVRDCLQASRRSVYGLS
jgi:hypothetical protein